MTVLRPRVLIVDDDESFGSMVREVLIDKGFDATFLHDPKAAAAESAARPYSVAVLDLHMPDVDGIELARHIRSTSPDTQVVILTGHADLDTAIEGLHEGIFDYLPKQSLRLSRLEHSVQEAAGRSRLLRENRDLVGRLSASNRLLQGLLEVGSSLAGEPHADRVLERLVASTRELCGAASARAVVFGHAHGGGFIIEHAAGDGSEEIRGARLQPGEGIAGLVAQTGEVVSVGSARDHARFSPRSDDLRADHAGFLCAPLRHGSVTGAVMAAGAPTGAFEEPARQALSLLSRHASVSIENALHHERSVNFFTHTCNLLVSVLDRLDIFEPGHSHAVAALAGMVTRRLGMGDADRRTVHFAALLHDIGKLGLEPALLKGEGALSADDAERIRQHPALGVQLLRPIALWEDVLSVIHAHHERWDGKGYPAGLAGEDIPLGARVVAVAESFDAMTRRKAYGRARTLEEGLAELESCAGTQFDPRIVRLFLAEYRRVGDPRQEAS